MHEDRFFHFLTDIRLRDLRKVDGFHIQDWVRVNWKIKIFQIPDILFLLIPVIIFFRKLQDLFHVLYNAGSLNPYPVI